ncbi:hypothetical protein C4E15_06345 [Achromobacter spanius]|uniref:Uncharacterized protein n=1 Tax=Achromobacter spanius TaxID=217203 RepID=A0A2S5GXP2_9BURK|nr:MULTISPECIES: hypothetical protein [Achromobacter]AYD66981.1 hypothetical protein DVB37_25975 [Achromobacter sp. B7]MDX3985126.1 hypothetical protein [Achromobacter sp.]PPA77625.1 hypothetical protein C4E15_06345 [Achromobacter spanius]
MSNPTALATLYQTVVQDELGLVARIDEDGDVMFRYPDLGTMFFSVSDADPEFLRLVYPSFVDANELGLTREQLLEVMNAVTHRCKAVKLSLGQDRADKAGRISASVEGFVAGPDSLPAEALLRGIVARCVSVIRHAAGELVKDALEQKQSAAG